MLKQDLINTKEMNRAIEDIRELVEMEDQLLGFVGHGFGEEDVKIGDILRAMAMMKRFKEVAKDASSALEKVWATLTISVVPEFLEDSELTTLSNDEVRLELRNQLQVSLPAPNRVDFELWLVDNDLEDMITTTINSSRLKSFVQNALTDGTEYPAHLLELRPFKQAVLVKK